MSKSHFEAKKFHFQNFIIVVTYDVFVNILVRGIKTVNCQTLMAPPGAPRGLKGLMAGDSGKIFWYKKVGLIRFRIVQNLQISDVQNHDNFDEISRFF